jgi:hypothetical protein
MEKFNSLNKSPNIGGLAIQVERLDDQSTITFDPDAEATLIGSEVSNPITVATFKYGSQEDVLIDP